MCPACLAVAAFAMTGAVSAGGISIMAYKTLRKTKSSESQTNKENLEK